MKAVRILTEYLDNPIGIATPCPRLFWNAEGEGFQQTVRLIYSVNGGKPVIMEEKTSSMHLDFPQELSSRNKTYVYITHSVTDIHAHAAEVRHYIVIMYYRSPCVFLHIGILLIFRCLYCPVNSALYAETET